MNALVISLCVLCQCFLAAGQVVLKHASNGIDVSRRRWKVAAGYILGTTLLAGWFFVWIGVLGRTDLSNAYPYEGLGPGLVVLGAWAILRERLHWSAWVGLLLIVAGVALVTW